MTVTEWRRGAEARLRAAGIESARLEADLLAAHVLRVERTWLYAHPEAEFPELAGEGLLQRRERHEPLAYLLGQREFYGRMFRTDRRALIPRQETETLVEAALARRGGRILDLGTGTGCVAITLALERPHWEVWAVDLSQDALDLAEANGESLGATVHWVLSDAFESVSGRFDLIVTNPPYIGVGEELMPEVRDWEPAQALFAGPSGFDFYDRLSREASAFLEPEGALLMEVGHTQGQEVAERFRGAGWQVDQIRKDLSGIDRVIEVCQGTTDGLRSV